MLDIWDDLFDIISVEDIEDIIERIHIVLQKGIPVIDQEGFVELQQNLQFLLKDINLIKEKDFSRQEFINQSLEIKEKYLDLEFDFEVLPILEEVITKISNSLDEKENKWKEKNLSLGDKSRESIHKWKEKIKFLPEYLSDETKQKINILNKEADELISNSKIEDVLFYFDKLNVNEKKTCIDKMKQRIDD